MGKVITRFLVLLSLLMTAACAVKERTASQARLSALEAGQAGDDEGAFAAYLEAAKLGDPFSQMEVGRRLGKGKGVAKDTEQAIAWFRLVVENNPQAPYGPNAAWNLACLYFRGAENRAPDPAEAARWMARPASTKAYAALALSTYYRLGVGVPQDRALADHWLETGIEIMLRPVPEPKFKGVPKMKYWYGPHNDNAEANAGFMFEIPACSPVDTAMASEMYLRSWKNGFPKGLKHFCRIQRRYHDKEPPECAGL